MAKKVVVSPDEDEEFDKENRKNKRKKRSKCCTCCLAFLTVCLVLVAAIFGVGWYFGDKYAKEYLGLSLGDTFGVLNGFYWTKDDDVVTNPYNKKDLDAFYGEIKENLLLKTDAEIDFDDAIKSALDSYLGDSGSKTATSDGSTPDGSGDSGSGDSGGNSGEADGKKDIMSILIDMVAEVFTNENIDKVRLAEYSEDNDEYIFELRDKQLAAFVNLILKEVLDGGIDIGIPEEISKYVKLADVVSLKQIRFKVQSRSDEQGVEYKVAACDLTVWIGLQQAAGQALTGIVEQQGFGWAGGLARWLGNVILPKNIYATVTVPLEDGATPAVRVNNMNAQKSANLYKIVDGVCANVMKNDMTMDSLLGKVTDAVEPFLEKTAGLLDFTDAGKGNIKIDLIGALADMMNDDEATDPLMKADFMYMLQAVLTSDPDSRLHDLEPYLYKDWYEGAGGKLVYKYDASTDTTGLTHVDYERKFIDEIKRVYPLKIEDGATLSDVLALFGVSIGGGNGGDTPATTEDILDSVDSDKFRASLSKAAEKLRVTDRMLAAMLNGELDTLVGDSALSEYGVELDALTFIKDNNKPTHLYALLAVSVNIESVIGSMGSDDVMKLVTNILPSELLISIQVDITKSLAAGDEYDPAQFMINDYEKTGRVLDTLKKIMPDFDLNSMTGDIEKMLRDMVLNLDDAIGIDLVASDPTATPVQSGALVLPDIFSVVTDMVFEDDSIKPDELQTVLRELVDTDGFSDTPNIASEDAFVDRVVDMYYIKDDGTIKNADDKFKALTEYLTDGADGFSADKFRIKYEIGDVIPVAYSDNPDHYYMAHDTRTIEQLKPYMTGAELGGLISERLTDGTNGGEDVTMFSVINVETSSSELTVTLKVDMGDILPAEVKKLLGIDGIYVTATVNVANPQGGAYPVTVAINHMEQGSPEYDSMMKIVRTLDADFNIESQVSEFGKILYEQLDSLKTSLGDDEFISFSNRGMEIAGFYEFLSSKLIATATGEKRPDPAKVKAAVQGMYQKPAEESLAKNKYNYVLDDFVVNRPKITDVFDSTATTFTDRQFNGNIQGIITLAGNDGVTVEQTVAIAKDDLSTAAKHVRDWANSRIDGKPIKTDKDYLIVTFSMEVGKMSDGGASQEASGFMPELIYATIALEKSADDTFTCVGTVFNDMQPAVYSLLCELMGLDPSGDLNDPDKINLKSITNDCLTGLNDLSQIMNIELSSLGTDVGTLDAPHGDGTATGIGSIKYTVTV